MNDNLSSAILGRDADDFAKSVVGRFMVAKAQGEIDAQMSLLVDADPSDIKLGTDIRNRIHVCTMFLTWLDEAIREGENAIDQIQQELDAQ